MEGEAVYKQLIQHGQDYTPEPYSLWACLGIYLLMVFGFILRALWATYKADLKNGPDKTISPWYLYMVGASRHKTIFNLLVMLAVAFFVPPHYLDILLNKVLPFDHSGMGHAMWIMVGLSSDYLIAKGMKKIS